MKNNGGFGQWEDTDMMKSGQILDTYFVGRFADRLDVMCERKIEVKNDLRNLYLEGWSCLQLRWEGKAADRAGFGGKALKLGFDHCYI